MNTIKQLKVEYIELASRTLETILLTNEKKQQKVVYLFNYEGLHFRIFESFIEVSNFFNNEPYKILKDYSIERFADKYLEKYQFVS